MTSYAQIEENCKEYYRVAREAFERLVGQVSGPDFAHATFEAVESSIQTEGMEILRLLAQGHLDQRRAQEKELDHVVGEDNEVRTHRRRDSSRQLESLFGEVQAHRCGYRGPGLDGMALT